MFEVTTKVTITAEQVANLMTSALEGGSGYWIESVSPRYKNHEEYSLASAYGPDMIARIFKAEDDETPCILSHATIQRGLDLMSHIAPNHWGDLVQETDDAETADVFLQLCLFGEIVYG
jgi:hypothetical protein